MTTKGSRVVKKVWVVKDKINKVYLGEDGSIYSDQLKAKRFDRCVQAEKYVQQFLNRSDWGKMELLEVEFTMRTYNIRKVRYE